MVITLLMAFALSLDGFGVGLSYGLRRIRLQFSSLLVIAFCTVLAMGISMLFGNWVTFWLKFIPAQLVGAIIILSLGTFQLIRAMFNTEDKVPITQAVPVMASINQTVVIEQPIFRIQIRFLGLIVQVMRNPDSADIDGSGEISLKESILLGSALAMDAFASGIGAALAGMTLSVIGIVALTQLIMIRFGQVLAGKIPEILMHKAKLLPGMVLILVGLGKLI